MEYSILMSIYYKDNCDDLKCSIDSMLNQTVFPNEFVIIEDGPVTKDIDKLIKIYKNKYKKLFKIIKLDNNSGLGIALKVGIENCSNEIIVRMDADDYSDKNRVQKQLNIFKKNKNISVVGTNVIEFENDIKNIISYVNLPCENDEIKRFSKKRNPIRHPSLMFKKSDVLEVGNYQDCPFFEDYDLVLRLLNHNKEMYNIQKYLVYMRVDNNFYKRRGGIKYLKNVFSFKYKQFKNHNFNFIQFLYSVIPHILICLLPNKVRKMVYRKLLRK